MVTVHHTGYHAEQATHVRSLPLGKFASWLLVMAFALSMTYQIYRAILSEVPAYDTFDLSTALGYAICFGIAVLAGNGRRWTKWLTLATTVFFTLLGILFYYPTLTPVRAFGPIDWTEAVLFMGLIFAAGVLTLADLFGVTLLAGSRHPRGDS